MLELLLSDNVMLSGRRSFLTLKKLKRLSRLLLLLLVVLRATICIWKILLLNTSSDLLWRCSWIHLTQWWYLIEVPHPGDIFCLLVIVLTIISTTRT